jgi:predicted CopG family antitoxin
MSRDTTTIEVKTETWKALNQRKEPGESFDDVIQRELAIGGSEPDVDEQTKEKETEWQELLQQWRDIMDDQPPMTSHGQAATEATLRELRQDSPRRTKDIREAVAKEFADEWPSSRDMWQSISRYFEDVPGIRKAGYGEWVYVGDQELAEEVADSR